MPNEKDSLPLRFGPFELNLATREFRKHGAKVRLHAQTFKLLQCLLEQPAAVVTRDQLRKRLWPEGIFVDFDHSLNAAVNRLREKLGDSAENSRYIETLPGTGYRFIGSIESVISPAPYDIVPPIPVKEERLPPKVKRLKYIFAMALATVVIVVPLFLQRRHAETSINSVALLPMHNDSPDAGQEYLTDGMTDQLITELGRFRELQVISRTSTEQYRGNSKPLAVIAQELKVKYLIEGAVARSANRVRVNVRLLESSSGRQIWAESYEDELNDALGLQENIARAVAQEIDSKVAIPQVAERRWPQRTTASAMEAYLKGKFIQAKGTKEALDQSILFFQEAIRQAPNYAGAYTALAESYCSLSTSYAAPHEVMPKARAAAERALALDSTSSEAHALMGRITAFYDWKWDLAEQHLRRAVELNPSSAVAHVYSASFLTSRGRLREALDETRKARELDPASLMNEVDLDLNLADMNELDLLETSTSRALKFDPSFPYGHTLLGWARGRKGLLADGIAHAERGARDGGSPVQVVFLGVLKATAGQRAGANELLTGLCKLKTKQYVCAHEIAGLQAALGQTDRALQSLELAYQERSDCIPFLRLEPMVNSLRAEPRFQELLRRIEQ